MAAKKVFEPLLPGAFSEAWQRILEVMGAHRRQQVCGCCRRPESVQPPKWRQGANNFRLVVVIPVVAVRCIQGLALTIFPRKPLDRLAFAGMGLNGKRLGGGQHLEQVGQDMANRLTTSWPKMSMGCRSINCWRGIRSSPATTMDGPLGWVPIHSSAWGCRQGWADRADRRWRLSIPRHRAGSHCRDGKSHACTSIHPSQGGLLTRNRLAIHGRRA